MSRTKLGHTLAKYLGITLEVPEKTREEVHRGESILSQHTTDTFVEEQPTSAEWLNDVTPNGKEVVDYLLSLFPFLKWIGFYNLQWFIGDLVAGEFFFCSKAPSMFGGSQWA